MSLCVFIMTFCPELPLPFPSIHNTSRWKKPYPNRDPRKPFDEVSFFSASAISCIAFCSTSAILKTKI